MAYSKLNEIYIETISSACLAFAYENGLLEEFKNGPPVNCENKLALYNVLSAMGALKGKQLVTPNFPLSEKALQFKDKLTQLFEGRALNFELVLRDFKSASFHQASREFTTPFFQKICAQGHFDQIQKIHDIGGGSGNFCEAFYKRVGNPAICMDLPENERVFLLFNKAYLPELPFHFQSFDFFRDPWMEIENAFLSNILHDYQEESVRKILRNGAKAKKIFLFEVLRQDDASDLFATCYHIMMKATLRSKQYSLSELKLFAKEECGKELRVLGEASPFTLMLIE